ncbi:MAG: pilus assembly protein TadG-related protein [Gemmatimonadales bacterium]
MEKKRRERSHRRGATLVLAVMAMITVGAVAAVAIDLGMLYKARSDAQRAAEAAALAGASAFVEFAAVDPEALDSADARARRFAVSNAILNVPVTAGEVQVVEVVPGSQKVRVVVGRAQVGTWFARMLGVTSIPVNARAAAVAVAAGGGSCVKPIAVPDTWREGTQDTNGNQLEENGEDWSYSPGQDIYDPGNPDVPAAGTGYGSNVRNDGQYTNDLGRPISLKLPDPTNPTPETGPRQFKPFTTTNSNNPATYLDNIEGCDPNSVQLGQQYQLLPPDPQIPIATQQGIDSLISADPNAQWDGNTNTVTNTGSQYGNWHNSPRVIKIGLFDPSQLGPGQTTVRLNNIGLMFLEGYNPATNTLSGRFLYFASGAGDLNNPSFGTLVKRLRLVE